MSWSLFVPLVLAGLVYAALSIAAGIVGGRGNEARAERLRDVGFLVVLLAGLWVIVLVLISIFNEPDEIWDIVTITLVVVVFFAVLLLLFFAISLLTRAIGRLMSRRSRVTTDEL